MENSRQPRSVIGVIEAGQKLLVIRRSQHVVAPHKVCFPGGSLLPGESEQDGLRRELREELALPVTPQRRIWQSEAPWGVELLWWSAAIEQGAEPIPNPQEVSDCWWAAAAELIEDPDLLESNQRFLAGWLAGEFDL